MSEDPALPIIRDEDFDKPHNESIASKEIKVLNTDNSDDNVHSNAHENKIRKPDPNAVYEIRRNRIPAVHNRLYSHQNRTKVRIQGKHGTKSEKYVNIQHSLEEQKKLQDRKHFAMRAKQRSVL